jgi:hypothetical protein
MRLFRALFRVRNTNLAGVLGRTWYVSNCWNACHRRRFWTEVPKRTGSADCRDVQDASGAAFRAGFRPIASSKLQLTISGWAQLPNRIDRPQTANLDGVAGSLRLLQLRCRLAVPYPAYHADSPSLLRVADSHSERALAQAAGPLA